MTPQFHPTLVNPPCEDPGLYIDFLFERRALLFDIGDVRRLPPRKLLRISHVFVSHTHVDHFIGFDHLVRLCLGREKRLHLFGPPGFVDQVGHRLAAYTWNLVESYPTDFTVVAGELHPDGAMIEAEFHCRRAFRREGEREFTVSDGIMLDEETFRVRSAFLDHRIPSLAFSLEEKSHVNIMKNRLEELGLEVGPWLRELKLAVLREEPDVMVVRSMGREGERRLSLGELKERILEIVPGQKIAYVTDAAPTPENFERIVALAAGSDHLFIETTFPDAEAERARERCHLTARQAGLLARRAGAVRVAPFHISPRYQGEEERLREELERAFAEG